VAMTETSNAPVAGDIPPEAADMTPPQTSSDSSPAAEPEAEPMAAAPEPVAAEPAEPSPTPPRASTPPPPAAPAPRRGGVFPLLLGGLIAGGIGYGAAWYLEQQQGPDIDMAAELAERDTAIAALEAQLAEAQSTASTLQDQIAALGEGPDLTPLQEAVDQASANAAAAATATEELGQSLTAQIDALDARLIDVEQRPQADGSLSSEAVAAYEREIAGLREDTAAAVEQISGRVETVERGFDTLSAEVSDRLDGFTGEIAARFDDMAAQAEAIEEEAAAAAAADAARAALADVQSAVNEGAPFGPQLAALRDIGAVEVPAALADTAEEGVASLSALRDSYPEAARAALATVRAEETGGGMGSFLQRQLNIRSVEPREGSTPDAVLSRAEAALTEGRLSAALDEVAALPEAAQSAMADWIATATARAEALAAVDTLTSTLTTN